jgi:hypothetical protein
MEKKCQQIHTQGVAQETGTQDKRKDPKLSLEEPGPAWSCSPSQRKGRKRPHGERESGAFPDTHSQGPPEVQVEEVLHLMSDRNIYIYIYIYFQCEGSLCSHSWLLYILLLKWQPCKE